MWVLFRSYELWAEFIAQTRMPDIPIQKRSINEVNEAFVDLQQGKVIGRLVLTH